MPIDFIKNKAIFLRKELSRNNQLIKTVFQNYLNPGRAQFTQGSASKDYQEKNSYKNFTKTAIIKSYYPKAANGVVLVSLLLTWPATLLKKRLWHRCFPVNFAKFLRTPFFIEHFWWLLLYKATPKRSLMIIKSLNDIRQNNLGKIMKGHLNINSIRQESDSTA